MSEAPQRPPVVLMGVDFSENSAAALREASTLARQGGMRLHGVHVRDSTSPTDAPAPDGLAWSARLGMPLDHFALRSGTPWVELVREAEAIGATTLVIGSHGRSGAQPVALGSTAARLVLASPCPVLVVRQGTRREPSVSPTTLHDLPGTVS